MSNPQLLLAIGIPSLLILANFTSMTITFRGLEHRIERFKEKTEARFERIEARFDRIEQRLTSLEVGIANLRAEFYEKFTLKNA